MSKARDSPPLLTSATTSWPVSVNRYGRTRATNAKSSFSRPPTQRIRLGVRLIMRYLAQWSVLTPVYVTDRLNACVMDGVNIGHPRCNHERCTNRLASPRDRFCPTHGALNEICAIGGCDNPVGVGFRTCGIPNHRHFETSMREKGRAIFQLKRRLEARAAAALERGRPSLPDGDPLDDPDVLRQLEDPEEERPTTLPVSGQARGPSASSSSLAGTTVLDRAEVADILGNEPRSHHSENAKKKQRRAPKVKTTLTRKWTHNEQLLVRPCGIVVSRASFFHAESPSNALVCNAVSIAPVL